MRENVDDRDRPQPELGAARHLDQPEEDQEEGRIFDEIAMRPHAGDQRRVAAVAYRNAVRVARPAHPRRDPDVEQGRCGGNGQGDRQYHLWSFDWVGAGSFGRARPVRRCEIKVAR